MKKRQTSEQKAMSGIANSPARENRKNNQQRQGDLPSNMGNPRKEGLAPTKRENNTSSVSSTAHYPVQYPVTSRDQQLTETGARPPSTSLTGAHPPSTSSQESLYPFANTRTTGENYSNPHQADLSGISNMPDGRVNSVRARPDGDNVNAAGEQSYQLKMYFRKPGEHASGNFDPRQQPMSGTSLNHQDNNQRTQSNQAVSPAHAIGQSEEGLHSLKLYFTGTNMLSASIANKPSAFAPKKPSASTAPVAGSTVQAQPGQPVKAVLSEDNTDSSHTLLKPEIKKRVVKELRQLPYDGRLLTYSIETFQYIVDESRGTLKGGFGTVYIHSNKLEGLGIPVVVKVVECKETEKQREKMMSVTNEKLASRTMHFSIVPLLAMTEDTSNSKFYFLTPYLENGDLREAIKRDTDTLQARVGDLTAVELTSRRRLKIIYQIHAALHFLHTPVPGFRGTIVHMDLKSMNIVLDKYYNARLIDFGLAREMNEPDIQIGVTESEILGYFRDTEYSRLTVKDDLYNFGIVIRELLTGKPAYDDETQKELRKYDAEAVFDEIQRIWYEKLEDPSKEASKLNEIAADCISRRKNPSQLKDDIENLLGPQTDAKWERSEGDDKCEMCMINEKASIPKGFLVHHNNCTSNISVCVACIGNRFKNPIICHTCDEIITLIKASGDKTDDVLPEEILNMGENALEIFKRALKHGKETDRSIRLMIVGHAGVGKTTLTEHILGQSKNTSNPVESTNGIDVHIKRCKIQFDTGDWLPINEVSQDMSMNRRLVNSLRAFSEKEQSNAFENKANNTTLDVKLITDVVAHVKENEHEAKLKSDKPITDAVAHVRENEHGAQVKSEQDSDRTASGSKRLINHDEQNLRSSASSQSFIMKELLEVIEEIQTRCTRVEKNTCDVSLWDFAGQYVFYCTHQVFLSRRAIYLLVTDLSKHIDSDVQDECNVDSDGVKTCKLSEFITFWLNSIYTYCGAGETRKPFVIIVGTFADKLPEDKRKEMAIKFFTAIRENVVYSPMFDYLVDEDFDINNMIQDPRIDELKKKIIEVAMNQKWWHEELPVKWVSLERIIGKRKDAGEKVLHRDVLIALNQQLTVPIDSEEELELFLGFYHDTGMIMYFSDDSLRDFILLDPQWLVDAFKTLITAEKFCIKDRKRLQMWLDFRKTAILSMDFVDCLWKSEGNEVFWENKSTLLQFMEKLGIIARPVPENPVDGGNIENKFFVPCMLKDAPPKDLITHLHNKSEQCKITSILCFASKSDLIPPHLFNKLIAACICRWTIAILKEGKLALFCGYAQFKMDCEHFLSLLFVNNGIQMWIDRYSFSGKEEPDQQICAAAKMFIERKLHQEIKERFPITVFWKCSLDESNVVNNMVPFDELLKQKNQRCSVHTGCHVITSRELRFWIHNEDISNSNVNSDNPIGYPLRKRVDDTMSERIVHMLREGMKSVGLLINNDRPCGTVFRVGSKFLMTALHCLKNIKDLAINDVYVDFNKELLLPQRKVYHLTSHKVFDENLDFVILEISDPDEQLPGALELDKDITDICSEMNSVDLIGYGHPDKLEKTLDRDCKLISAKHLQSLEPEAEQWLMENKSSYRTALKLKLKDPDLVNMGYQDINMPGKFLLHCFMTHGASGAPVITTLGSKAKVVGMLTLGLPKFYFYLPKALQIGFKTDLLFEMASMMSSIYQCVMTRKQELAVDLFK